MVSSFVKCTCCGELLTKPCFYNGLPYGSSCVKKFGAKVTPSKLPLASFEILDVKKYGSPINISDINMTLIHVYTFVIMFEGKKYSVGNAKSLQGNNVIIGFSNNKLEFFGNNGSLCGKIIKSACNFATLKNIGETATLGQVISEFFKEGF